MTEQKLSPAQAAVLKKMKTWPIMVWWTAGELPAVIEDLNALVEKDILIYSADPTHAGWWRLKQRALMPKQKQIIETMRAKAGQGSWKAVDLPGDEIDLEMLEEEGLLETVYRLTVDGLALLF